MENPSILKQQSKDSREREHSKEREWEERIKTASLETRNALTVVDRGHIQMSLVNQVKSKAGTTSKATEASAGAVPARSEQSKPATPLKRMLGELVASNKVEAELSRLEEAGIIETVDSATDWISPIVIAPKKDSNEIRMCVDMVEPNWAIKRTWHVIPTVKELRHDLNGAKIFSKLDLTNDFHQLELELELDEESKSITTFSTLTEILLSIKFWDKFSSRDFPRGVKKEIGWDSWRLLDRTGLIKS
ncbi:Hypothetical predicted protein [Paramuricea clavata]|uniref:Uncharacterized protein n=1 Tax=Paramuricea clavata TaxID=317549 RepID=A0A7D9HD90_PARCT|nr:Hypothetical predicted protein [Paramuricea clavata]